MTQKTHALIEGYRLFKVGFTEALVAHIGRLERSDAFVRRLAKLPCETFNSRSEQACDQYAPKYRCLPCKARRVLKGAKL